MKIGLGAILGAVAGGVGGFLFGGPAGAAAGAAKGAAILGAGAGLAVGHGIDTAESAKKHAKREALIAGEHTRSAAMKADKLAKEQGLATEHALRKISSGRVRAANRRVRGGLFGDTGAQQQYQAAAKLGGGA